MSKFKIGDKVVRVNGGGGWKEEIPVGHCYTVLNEEDEYINVLTHHGHGWLLDFRFELYEEKETEMTLVSTMTAEQIRNEILRIRVRIEEAKKDIESAEKEHDSLVEKLREKGFEMFEQGAQSKRSLEVGDKVVVIGRSEAYHECDYTGLEGTLEHDDGTGRPYKVFLNETEQSHWFARNEIEKI